MRIIRGIYGNRRFQVPSTFNARPTTDFAKESLFNVLDNLFDWDGRTALDLFSGTGSIALEMLSRGCKSVIAIELNHAHAFYIGKVAKVLQAEGLQLIRGDVFRYLKSAPKQAFDLIFADPPYVLEEALQLPGMILNGDFLRPGGIFVMEHSKKQDFSALPHFHQQRTYGSVNFSIFIYAPDAQ